MWKVIEVAIFELALIGGTCMVTWAICSAISDHKKRRRKR
jgi:hypothetical protein